MDINYLQKIHSQYKEKDLVYRHFQPEEFYQILHRIPKQRLSINELGKSAENRPIYSLKFGNGKTPILLWSQMHGNEPTATMALLDIFHLLEKKILN